MKHKIIFFINKNKSIIAPILYGTLDNNMFKLNCKNVTTTEKGRLP